MNMRKLQFAFVTALTVVRIPLVLIFLVVNLVLGKADSSLWFAVAFYSMLLSALSDLFDGYFARRFKVVTRLGGLADPLMDKAFYVVVLPALVFRACVREEPFFHCSALVALTVVGLFRDQWVSFLRSIGSMHKADTKANWSGKLRTVVFFGTLCTAYWYIQVPPTWRLQIAPWVVYTLEAASFLLTLISLWVYTSQYWPHLRREAALPLDAPGPDLDD